MSAGRRHRRAAGRWQTEQALREAAAAPAVLVGSCDLYDIFMKASVMFMLPRVLPGMPAELAEALTRRRTASLEGRCACGGRQHVTVRQGHVGDNTFLHDEECPAHDRALAEIAARTGWKRAGNG